MHVSTATAPAKRQSSATWSSDDGKPPRLDRRDRDDACNGLGRSKMYRVVLARRWPQTRPMTQRPSLRTCVSRASFHMSRRTSRAVARPLIDGQPGTRTTPRASVPASGSKKLSAGSRPSAAYGRLGTEDETRCAGPSRSPQPPTISSDCPNSSERSDVRDGRQRDAAVITPTSLSTRAAMSSTRPRRRVLQRPANGKGERYSRPPCASGPIPGRMILPPSRQPPSTAGSPPTITAGRIQPSADFSSPRDYTTCLASTLGSNADCSRLSRRCAALAAVTVSRPRAARAGLGREPASGPALVPARRRKGRRSWPSLSR